MRRLALISALAVAVGCEDGSGLAGFVPANLPASRLAMSVQPSDVAVSTAIAPTMQVLVQNANGLTMTNSSAAVTMAITPGTGTAGAVLTGQLIVNAVNGVASFNNVRIDQAGTGYTLTASAPGLTPVATAAFAVTP